MAHENKKNNIVQEPEVTRVQLNASDYLNLCFTRDAPSLGDPENKELFNKLKDVGVVENNMMFLNSFILCIVIYFMLWLYQGEINHLGWSVPFLSLLPVPFIISFSYYFRQKNRTLTYREFVLGQLIIVPFVAYAWLEIGLKLAPESGVIQDICYGIIAATCMYCIIWFRTVPIVTFFWTLISGVVMSYIYSGQINAQLSQLFSIIFLTGVNAISLYLFITEVIAILDRISMAKMQVLNQFLVNTFEKNSKDFLWQANNRGEITYASNQLQLLLQAQAGNDAMAEPNVLLNKNNQFGSQIRDYIHSEENFELFFAKLEYEGMMEYWAVTGDPLYDDKGIQIGFSGFGTNITAVQQAERRKNQVENYQSITHMASMIGNDFYDYLSSVVEFLYILPKSKKENPNFEKRRNALLYETQEALGMTTQLRDLGLHESDSFDQIIIYKFLDNLIEEMQLEYSSDLNFIHEISCNTFIHANENQFSRCIRNVVENSISAMNGSGTIYIDVTTLQANSVEIERFMLDKPGKSNLDYAYIRIKDTGSGFSTEIIDNVFEPFVSTDDNFGGKGLGLAMVDNFCLQHQGFVLASNANDGAVIEIVIPQEQS